MMTRQKSGVSILRMQKLLKIGSYRTAWLMGHKIRDAMVDRNSDYKLAGLIEIDEATIGRQKSGKRRIAAKGKAKVLIGVERSGAKAGFRLMGQMDRTDSELTTCLSKGEIDPRIERSLRGRDARGALEKDFVNPNRDALKNARYGLSKLRWVYAVLANINGNIRGVHHGVSIKHLQKYLSEYCYRFNLRRRESQLFNSGLTDCVATRALTWDELTI